MKLGETLQSMDARGKRSGTERWARVHYRPDRDGQYPYFAVSAQRDEMGRWYSGNAFGSWATLNGAKRACEQYAGFKLTEWVKG